MKRLIAMMIVLSLVLCGCGGGGNQETTAPETTAPVETTVPETTAPAPTEAPTEPTEAPPVDVNPLTGEALDEVNNNRPYAVMINNMMQALPQCGISQADILVEILVEGEVTRFMAIFTDMAGIPNIGPCRSVRPYFINIARSFDAMIASAGGSDEAYTLIYSIGQDYLNGVGDGYGYFYRDQWRMENKGYEHSLLTTGDDLLQAAVDNSFRMTESEGRDYNMTFDDTVAMAGAVAEKLTFSYHEWGKTNVLTYDAGRNGYTLYQHGTTLIDGNTEQELVFRNVLVLLSDSYVKDNKGHLEVQTSGEGDGYYLRDGVIIPIRWSRESHDDPFTYTDADGNPITFGVGTTYMTFLPDGSPVSYQ